MGSRHRGNQAIRQGRKAPCLILLLSNMKLKELERQLAHCRKNGANDDTIVQGFESQDRLTPFAGPATDEQKKRYFTVRDVCLGERSPEYGGGKVIRIYHYTV